MRVRGAPALVAPGVNLAGSGGGRCARVKSGGGVLTQSRHTPGLSCTQWHEAWSSITNCSQVCNAFVRVTASISPPSFTIRCATAAAAAPWARLSHQAAPLSLLRYTFGLFAASTRQRSRRGGGGGSTRLQDIHSLRKRAVRVN